MTTILAASPWRNNSELIADVARLGYLDGMVLDPTYGKGNWWTIYRPPRLACCDIHGDGVMKVDFTDMPFEDNTFDAVAFDPPYVSVGGRSTSTIQGMHAAYGLTNAPTSPGGVQSLIEDGMKECVRVLRPGGYLLVKCQDYVSSGKLWEGTFYTQEYAKRHLGLETCERFEHYGPVRPQPPGRRQVHARRNLSTLFVFRKPR